MSNTATKSHDLSGGPSPFHPTWEMARSRTIQLAQIAGREAHQIRQGDYERAKRELTGETNPERQQAVFDNKY